VEFHQKAISEGHCREAALTCLLKVECGQRVPRGMYDTRILKRCLNLGYVGQDKKGHYWQLPWPEICKEHKSITYAYIDHKDLRTKDYKVLGYCIITGYLLRIHVEDGGKPLGKREPKGKRTLKPGSVHEGGLANSVMGKFCKKSKQWASKMRKSAVKSGLMKVTQRHVACPAFGHVDVHERLPAGHFRLHDGSVAREVASVVEVKKVFWYCVPSRMRGKGMKRKFNAKEGVYEYV
jgi:hypothetical protein